MGKHENEQQVVVRTRTGHSVEAHRQKEDTQGTRTVPVVPEQIPRDASPVSKVAWSALPSARSATSSSFVPSPLGSGMALVSQMPVHQSPQMQKRDVTPTAWHAVTSTPQ